MEPSSSSPARTRIPRVVALLVALAGLGALASSDAAHAAVLHLFELAREVIASHPVAGPLAFMALAALSAMLAFFSSAVIVPAAILAWGALPTAALLLAGWLLGGLTAYTLARSVGRPALRWLAPGRYLDRDVMRLTREVSWGFVVLFQLVLPSEVPGFVLGLARYPVWRYLAALAVAELPYAIGTVLLGVSFMERRIGLLLALGSAVVLFVAVAAPVVRRRMT